MSGIWAPTVTRAASFLADVESVRPKFPDVDEWVDSFEYVLKTYWTVPHFPVDPDAHPNIYAEKLDYPPLGAKGAGAFIVTYHVVDGADNPMQGPMRHFTLLSITPV